MHDIDHGIFIDDKNDSNPIELAARRAVVLPITGDRDTTVQSANEVVTAWRKCLDKLYAIKLPKYLSGKNQWYYCRNCPPVGYQLQNSRKLRCCGRDAICPHCHGRTVQRVVAWVLRSCRALSVDERSRYALVGFRLNKIIGIDESSADFSDLIQRVKKNRRQIYLEQGAIGSYFSLGMSPRHGAGSWSMSYRFIMLIPIENLPNKENGDIKDGDFYRMMKLGKRSISPFKVARLIARILTYPKGLLVGDPKRVKKWLNARRKHRLSVTYGLFRGTEHLVSRPSGQNQESS